MGCSSGMGPRKKAFPIYLLRWVHGQGEEAFLSLVWSPIVIMAHQGTHCSDMRHPLPLSGMRW